MVLCFTALTDCDSSLPRPEAPRPSVSPSPLPPPEVELQSGRISRDPEPVAGSQAKELATVSSPAPMSPTRRRALDHYLTLRRWVCRITFPFFLWSFSFETFLVFLIPLTSQQTSFPDQFYFLLCFQLWMDSRWTRSMGKRWECWVWLWWGGTSWCPLGLIPCFPI